MADRKVNPGNLVFGLDIGTRSVVGTVGYKSGDTFHVVAQSVREHKTRSMLDGQIHDIEKVGATIYEVKEELEKTVGHELNEVCIAAAGRVLKTVESSASLEFNEDTTVDSEHVYTLEMLGVEKAYESFQEMNDSDVKFYCVGYTVKKYYLNDYPMTALERHKAKKISVELISTFLPDEVVDGLYKAVEIANLQVANLTLEPIAAMTAAIPVNFRMLNIALVDVGAGTSDISITKDGSIIAYGMIPMAGDEFTEAIASSLLLDFNEAEHVKIETGKNQTIKYTDIMCLDQKIESEEVIKIVEPLINNMTKEISDRIKELNGNKPVSAVFVVGGGGKIPTFTEALAKEMGIMSERVAVRGEEVLRNIDYQFNNPQMDSMFVTPIGICLNFYDQRNNFVFVTFNGERIKLYDNGHLTVADAAMQTAFPNEGLFPKRGSELTFTVNGKPHMVRGELGEPAVITLNDKDVSLSTPISAGDKIFVKESSVGAPAKAEIRSLSEYGGTISVIVNDKRIDLPEFAQVNGVLQSEFYEIQTGDDIKMLGYYTVEQITEFMDVTLKEGTNIYVNNKFAELDTRVYDNFSVIWSTEDLKLSDVVEDTSDDMIEDYSYDENYVRPANKPENAAVSVGSIDNKVEKVIEQSPISSKEDVKPVLENTVNEIPVNPLINNASASVNEETVIPVDSGNTTITVFVNKLPVKLSGKKDYIFVDVFDYIDFDLSKPHGSAVVTMINGRNAMYAEPLSAGDVLEIYWK